MAFVTVSRRVSGFALAGVLLLAGLPQGQAQAQTSTDTFCRGVVSPFAPTDFARSVDRYSTAEANADCVLGYELMKGYDDGTFRGNKPMTRAQTASIVVNFVQKATNATVILPPDYTHSFTDIEGSIHQDSILKAHRLGLFNGVTETEFHPNDPVTREQFATILVQAFRAVGKVFPTVMPPHNFTNIENSVHKDNIILATHYGYVDALQAGSSTPPGGPSVAPPTATATFVRLSHMKRYSIASVIAIGGTAVVAESLWKSPVLAEETPPPAPIEEVCDQLCESMKM